MMTAEQLIQGATLSGLLQGLAEVPLQWDRPITSLTLDSRTAKPGSLFLACKGSGHHGLEYLDRARRQGAVAVAWEPDGDMVEVLAASQALRHSMPMLRVDELRRKASLIAARFYDFPSQRMWVAGVTGTNGKTSVTHLLAQTLGQSRKCGLIGTLGVGFVDDLRSTGLTTPDAVSLQAQLAGLYEQGAQAVAMEVSSHALDQGRADAVLFDSAVFTNISRDHFDYHGSLENYAMAKRRLFHMPHLRRAVVNLDDSMGEALIEGLAHELQVFVYTLNPAAEIPTRATGWVRAESVEPQAHGLCLRFSSSWGEGEVYSNLFGQFNAANLLAVFLLLMEHGMPLEEALRRLSAATTVAGRMQVYGTGDQPAVVIDYAHTPDALEKALTSLRDHCTGRLWAVFGCGGDRDRGKRPQMARVAEQLADRIILTDDNPRTEAGDKIIAEMLAGLENSESVMVERDRAQAIRQAVEAARPGDIVLVAGKGHEDYQLVGNQVLHFSDQEQVQAVLDGWRGGEA